MPTMERNWIKDHPGVYFIETTRPGQKKPVKIFYLKYRLPDGRVIEEKAVRGNRRITTAKEASRLRAAKEEGRELPNADRRAAIRAEKAAEQGRWTLTRLWDDYKAVRYGDTPPLTEKANWKNHLCPLFADKEPHEISTLDIERLKSFLAKKGKKPGTVAKVTELVRRLINWGVDREYYPVPAVRVRLPRVPLDREPEFLSDAELARLLAVLDAYEDATVANIVRVALLTGIRRSEILRLEWDHVDERGYLRITESKGGQDQSIPLSDAARAVLSSIPRTPDPKDPEKELPLVFPGRGGKRRADVNKDAKAIKAAAELPASFRLFHGARHHFASTLASSGVDLYVIARLLTHRIGGMGITARYSHLSDSTLRAATNIMGEHYLWIQEAAKAEANEREKTA